MSYANAAAKNADALRANEAHPDTSLLEDHHKGISRADGLGADNKVEVVSADDAARLKESIENPPSDAADAAHFDELRAQRDAAANKTKSAANTAAKEADKASKTAQDKAGQAAKGAQKKANQVEKDAQDVAQKAQKEGKRLADDAQREGQKLYDDASKAAKDIEKDAKGVADKVKKEGKQFMDDASKKAKDIGNQVESEARRLRDDPEGEGKRLYSEAEKQGKKAYDEAASKGRELKNELNKDLKKAEAKAQEWEKEGRELVKKYPRAATGIIGAINAAVLIGVGYSAISNWDKPRWDRRTVTLTTVGLLAFFTGQGALGYYEYEKNHEKTL